MAKSRSSGEGGRMTVSLRFAFSLNDICWIGSPRNGKDRWFIEVLCIAG